jgi:ubiquinone/menaquinone biosynthesis C-methylase UbiE
MHNSFNVRYAEETIPVFTRRLDSWQISVQRKAFGSLELSHGDVRELPYGNGVFDLVMTAHVLEHLVDPSVALNEMVRALKPGGLLVACVGRKPYLPDIWDEVPPRQQERNFVNHMVSVTKSEEQ